ncbi:MAG: LytTR family DNA-binding domain-containing protein [Bacteroidales bacterium]|jgi:two-component system LytT family response regulator|nr:LytTR family DNA-binding domain-containing protein [Bacteroidales bacterium]HOI31837.1 LytTR family DNA-binding domain-containing protein [Bacteroidales bacterium]
MSIKAIIVDDEANARQVLLNMLQYYCKDIAVVGQADSVATAYELIMEQNPEVIFLDIKMPGENGFELIKKFKAIPFKIIFVTAFDHFALRAIKLSAVDYLLKPVSPRELIRSVAKLEQQLDVEDQYEKQLETLEDNLESDKTTKKIILNTSTTMHVVKIDEVIRCEADENYTHVIRADGKTLLVSKTLKEFEDLLSPYGFCRVHQSHLINLNHVVTYEKSGNMVFLSTKEHVPVSSRRKEYFLSSLQQYI